MSGLRRRASTSNIVIKPTSVASCQEYTTAVATMKIVASDVAPAATPTMRTGKASATVAPRRNTPAPANADAGVPPSWVVASADTAAAPAITGATTNGNLGTVSDGSRICRTTNNAESITAKPPSEEPRVWPPDCAATSPA